MADISPRKRRAEAIGFFAATADIGLITGPAVGFAVATALGFRELFLTSMAMALVALACSLFARERPQPSTGRRPAWTLRNGLIPPASGGPAEKRWLSCDLCCAGRILQRDTLY